MNQEHGKQKPGKKKRRNPEQPQKPPQQSAASSPPSTHRMSRKEAAQAQAKKNRQLRILIGGVAAVILLVAVVIFVNRPTDSGIQIDYSGIAISQSDVVRNSGSMPGDSSPNQVTFATGSTVGDPNAPVTMHIFSDFQCHFCKVFHDETLPLIIDDFVRPGNVKLVFHDLPRLGSDPSIADPEDLTVELGDENNESSLSSQAAICAGEQDQYLEMSEKLFGNYRGIQSDAFSRSNLDRFAGDLDLDVDEFGECMDSERFVPALAESINQGQALGITGTPMFILDNGSGDLNVIQQTELGYEMLKRQIEASIQTAP